MLLPWMLPVAVVDAVALLLPDDLKKE